MSSGRVTVYGNCSRMWTGEESEEYVWSDQRDVAPARKQASETAGQKVASEHARVCGCDTLQLSAR